MPKMIITWHALLLDPRTCRRCRLLNGDTWQFEPSRDSFPDKLYGHGDFVGLGPVWDCVADQSMAHGYSLHHCRCHLSIEWDLSDLESQIKQLSQAIKTAAFPRVGLI